MTKKKIHKLSFEPEADFILIGIASHENDYRLSWAINKTLNLDLIKIQDLVINHPKHKIDIRYSRYNFEDDDNYLSYHLIANQSEKGFLLPDMKNIDFILKISGIDETKFIDNLLTRLKRIDIIIAAFLIEHLPDRINKLFIF